MIRCTNPPKRFATSDASSREKLLSSPVKMSERPARQSGAPLGVFLEPWATGPAGCAAFLAAQLQKYKDYVQIWRKKRDILEFIWLWSIMRFSRAIGWLRSRHFGFGGIGY